MPNEVMRSRTVSIPRQICERGNGSRERKHRMQEQQQPTARQVQVVQRVLSAVPHTRARLGSRHTHRSARAGSSHTHSRRAFGSSRTHTGRTYLRRPLAARASHTLGTPSAAASHTSRLCPAASHTRARAIPSDRWSSRRAFTAGGSLQAHGVMREAGTRARAHAHVPSCPASHRARAFTRRAP